MSPNNRSTPLDDALREIFERHAPPDYDRPEPDDEEEADRAVDEFFGD